MRRLELVNGIDEVLRAIKTARVDQVLEKVVRASGGEDESLGTEFFEAFQIYSGHTSQWSAAAHQIAMILGLSNLMEARFWSGVSKRGFEATDVSSSIHFTVNQLPKLVELLRQEGLHGTDRETSDDGESDPQFGLLSLVLLEGEHEFSKPQRFIDALTSIDDLYQACAGVLVVPGTDLSVVACDSGSDKSFDFLGTATVMTSLKQLILELWDRVIFYRDHKIEQRFGLIAESLPILEKIGELRDTNSVSSEQAELLKRKVIDGATKFLSCGATIPEIEERTNYDPRVLMTAVPKLLTPGVEEKSEESTSALSEEERRVFDELSRKVERTDSNDYHVIDFDEGTPAGS